MMDTPRRTSFGIALSLATAGTALAQTPSDYPLALSAQLSIVPLYEGDATVGRYIGLGPSIRLSYAPRFTNGRGFLEAHTTRTFGSHTVGKPRLTSVGLMLGASLGTPTGWVRGAAAAGVSRLSFDLDEGVPCLPPQCFAEGGGNFKDAGLTAVVGGLGITIPGPDRFAVRTDIRAHFPITSDQALGDNGDVRFELAFGVAFRW